MASRMAVRAGSAAPVLLALVLCAACRGADASSSSSAGTTVPATNGTGFCSVAPAFDVQETSSQMFLDIAGALARPARSRRTGLPLSLVVTARSPGRAAVARDASLNPRCALRGLRTPVPAAGRRRQPCACWRVNALTHSFRSPVIMLVCRFVGLIFRAAGQPTVIGEIIAGASACGSLRCARELGARASCSCCVRAPRRSSCG